jgi:hypothetical protein
VDLAGVLASWAGVIVAIVVLRLLTEGTTVEGVLA